MVVKVEEELEKEGEKGGGGEGGGGGGGGESRHVWMHMLGISAHSKRPRVRSGHPWHI